MGVLKIGGLASGLDTDNLIKTLMTFEKRPVVQLQTRSDTLTSEANAWRDLNSRMLTLMRRTDDLINFTDSVWTAKRVAVADSSILLGTNESTAVPGTYSVEVTTLASATMWQSGLMGTGAIDSADKVLNLSGTVKVATGPQSGKTFVIEATDTLNTIAAKINKDTANLGFTASVMQVSPGDYRLVLKGKNGAAQDFSLVDDTGTAGDTLKITGSTATKASTAANGLIKVNGLSVTISDNTVKDAVPGTTLSLIKTGTTQVTVTKDAQKVVDAVKNFVSQYNSVIDFMGQLTSYDKDTKKAGTLLGDARINDLDNSLAGLFINPVKGLPDATNSLAMVGVTTEQFSAGGKLTGHLTVDETKLKAALEKDPDAVKKLFTTSDSTNPGVFVRAKSYLDNYTKSDGILLGRADAIDKNIKVLKDRIQEYNDRVLPMREQRLRDQFTNLEKALSTFQNQGKWLSSQLAQMTPAQQ